MGKERSLIFDGIPCDINMHPDGPKTLAEARQAGRQPCPYWDRCSSGFLRDHQCVMSMGREVAKYVLSNGVSLGREMQDFRRDAPRPAGGYIWSADRENFELITDFGQVVERVRGFARQLLGLDASPEPTEAVGGSFQDVLAHATTQEGAVDLAKLDRLEGRCGHNGNRGCDVTSGPCSCGAWH
jgi:hypothetical protein